MIIRLARSDDYEAVARLNAEVQQVHADALPDVFKAPSPSGSTFTRSDFDDMLLRPGGYLYVAVAEHPVGYVFAEVLHRPETSSRYTQRVIQIHHVCVSAEHRRRGYGHQLVGQVVRLAKSLGITRLELDVWSFNPRARIFFEGAGFAEFNVRLAAQVR
jgi:diamine N-acetyltransferase